MASLSATALAPAPSGISAAAATPSPARTAPEAARDSQRPAQVRYLSPVIEIDAEAGLALLQVRDVENGNVRFQLPPERVVREYKAVEAATAPAKEPARAPEAPASAAEAAAAPSLTSIDPADPKQA